MTDVFEPVMILSTAVVLCFIVQIAITLVGLRCVLDDREIVLPFAVHVPQLPNSREELAEVLRNSALASAVAAVQMCISLGAARMRATEPLTAAREHLAASGILSFHGAKRSTARSHYQTLSERMRARQRNQQTAA